MVHSRFVFRQKLQPSGGSAWKAKKLNSVTLPLLKAWNGILAHSEEQYPVPGLPVDFSKEDQKAQLKGMFTEGG